MQFQLCATFLLICSTFFRNNMFTLFLMKLLNRFSSDCVCRSSTFSGSWTSWKYSSKHLINTNTKTLEIHYHYCRSNFKFASHLLVAPQCSATEPLTICLRFFVGLLLLNTYSSYHWHIHYFSLDTSPSLPKSHTPSISANTFFCILRSIYTPYLYFLRMGVPVVDFHFTRKALTAPCALIPR
jgi:hypothetical protein